MGKAEATVTKIYLRYSNDRGDPSPVRINEEGDSPHVGPGHPCLWRIVIDGELTGVAKEWESTIRRDRKLTMRECGDETERLIKMLGLNDPSDQEEWRKHGLEILPDNPVGFVNWPDPDLNKGYG